MRKFEDLTGREFGRWTVIKLSDTLDSRRRRLWLCRCSCDEHNEKIVRGDILKSGQSQSCGCLHKEISKGIGERKKKFNRYVLTGEYGIGYTSNTNEPFYFDLEDYDKIKDHCWMKDKDGYIWTAINKEPVRMHRLILGLNSEDPIVDHKNRIRWDNKKINIKEATYSENNHNTNKQTNNKSGKKGVHKHPLGGYNAQLTFQGETKRKYFKTLEEAVIQRKAWEMELFGYYFDN